MASLAIEGLDVGFGLAGNVRGHCEGVTAGGDFYLLSVQELAINFVGQLDGVIAQTPAGSGVTGR